MVEGREKMEQKKTLMNFSALAYLLVHSQFDVIDIQRKECNNRKDQVNDSE